MAPPPPLQQTHQALQSDAKPSTIIFQYNELAVFSDGSFLRSPHQPPNVPPTPSSPGDGAAVATKDLALSSNISARLYLPLHTSSSKLPVLLYFHGGCFCLSTTCRPHYNAFLSTLAAHTPTLIVSVDYRLAPEHPLPAAYDDGFDALLWLGKQAQLQARGSTAASDAAELEPWLYDHADFSKCFLGGDSAGANLSHHVALRAGKQTWEGRLRLQGMMLIHPFFSSEVPTDSELRSPLKEIIEHCWSFCLPTGASRDHPFSNPLAADAPSLAEAELPRALVTVASEDVLKERGVAYYEALKHAGKDAKLFLSENEEHIFFLHTAENERLQPFLQELVSFLNSSKGPKDLEGGPMHKSSAGKHPQRTACWSMASSTSHVAWRRCTTTFGPSVHGWKWNGPRPHLHFVHASTALHQSVSPRLRTSFPQHGVHVVALL